MAGYLLHFNTDQYPDLEGLIAGQRVRISIQADVIASGSGNLTLKTTHIAVPYKSKLSTSEILMSNMDSRLASLDDNKITGNSTP